MSVLSPSSRIHPTAVLSEEAELGEDVLLGPGVVLIGKVVLADGCSVGPYAVLGPEVTLGAHSTVGAHALVEGPSRFGERTHIYPHAAVGGRPQDLKFHGEEAWLLVGDGSSFREFCTVQRGTEGGGGVTRVGSGCLVMAYAHIAHDCTVGNKVIFSNGASLGGHVTVEDGAILGALCGVHQFGRVGQLAMVGAGAMAARDVPPFTLAQGDRARLYGLNTVGLRRAGVGDESIRALKGVYRLLLQGAGSWGSAWEEAQTRFGGDPLVDHLLEFVARGQGERGVMRGDGSPPSTVP